MTKILFKSILFCLLFAGCGNIASDTSNNDVEVSDVARTEISETHFEFTVDSVDVSIDSPESWSVNATQYGVVLTERIRSIATEGQLDGILLHIFVDPLENVTLSTNNRQNNLALNAFNQIVIDSSYIGDALTSAPEPFQWQTLDAAYYLLANGDGNVSIVLGVIAPETNRLVTIVISAPFEQSSRIRASLPELLTSLTVNDVTLGTTSLDRLPETLEFPVPAF